MWKSEIILQFSYTSWNNKWSSLQLLTLQNIWPFPTLQRSFCRHLMFQLFRIHPYWDFFILFFFFTFWTVLPFRLNLLPSQCIFFFPNCSPAFWEMQLYLPHLAPYVLCTLIWPVCFSPKLYIRHLIIS